MVFKLNLGVSPICPPVTFKDRRTVEKLKYFNPKDISKSRSIVPRRRGLLLPIFGSADVWAQSTMCSISQFKLHFFFPLVMLPVSIHVEVFSYWWAAGAVINSRAFFFKKKTTNKHFYGSAIINIFWPLTTRWDFYIIVLLYFRVLCNLAWE